MGGASTGISPCGTEFSAGIAMTAENAALFLDRMRRDGMLPAGNLFPAMETEAENWGACGIMRPEETVLLLGVFPEPEKLIETLSGLLKPGGKLTVAHGMSRAAIDSHHSGAAHPVSNGLMHEDALRALLTPYCDVDVCVSDERMYQVAGTKRI